MKLHRWIIGLVFVFVLAACGGAPATSEPATDETAAETEAEAPATEGDTATDAEAPATDEGSDAAASEAPAVPGAPTIDEDDPLFQDDTLAFRIEDEEVTAGDVALNMHEDFAAPIQGLLAQGSSQEEIEQIASEQSIREGYFDQMIQDRLLLRVARAEGIGVDPEVVEQQMEQARQSGMPLSPDGEDAQREEIAERELINTVIAQNTTADMFNSRHILVEDEATAEEVLARLEDGDDFAELAAEYSTDPGSKDTGGGYGWVPRGSFVAEYEEVAFNAELNEPVIVESQFGWHIIIVDDREEGRAFENFQQLTSAGNAQQLYEESFLPWYEGIREEAIEEGVLEINADFDPAAIPLPFPPEGSIPAAPPALQLPPGVDGEGTEGGDSGADTEGNASPDSAEE